MAAMNLMNSSGLLFTILAGLLGQVSGELCYYYDSFSQWRSMYCSWYCCGSSYSRYCCHTYLSVGGIAGTVIGGIIFIAFLVTICSCCCCACCPIYQRRQYSAISNGPVIVTESSSAPGTIIDSPPMYQT